MKKKSRFQRKFFLVLCGIFMCISTLAAAEPETTYRIGPEDILEISVWKDPDLTKEVVIRPDGRLSFPLIGEVETGGQTVAWLQEKITKRIREYVPDAMVTVMVTQINSMRIYVVGKVARPGEYKIGKRINVMQALALAGGLVTFADEGDILILRGFNGEQKKIPFRYNEVKKGKKIEQNILLQAGDVVVVP